MTKAIFVFQFVFLAFAISLQAQLEVRITNTHADCDQAIDITGVNQLHATAPVNSGKRIEIHSSKISLYSFNTEHHTVWYKFTAEQSCEMSFTIAPDNPRDDYDFILFRAAAPHICQSIRKGELKPVRSNISRPTESGKTGLDKEATSYYVHEGKGNAWSKSIYVKKGEVFYLVLDNVYKEGGGHRLSFYYNNCKEEPKLKNTLSVNINVKDQESKRLIRANILLVDQSKGYRNYDTIYNKVSTSVFIPVEPGRYYECEVWTDGYLKAKEIFKLDTNDQSLKLDMELQAVSIGKTFELGNLYFEGGTANVIRKSYPILRDLLAIMKDNPDLEIEIQGHVNLSPDTKEKKTEEYYQHLSIARAKTVYDYLAKRGVAKSRMNYIGFGYSRMIFKHPKSAEQMQRNRRVVVKIIKI